MKCLVRNWPLCLNVGTYCSILVSHYTDLLAVCDAVGTCISSLILALRTQAGWNGDCRITLLLGLLFAGQIADWTQSRVNEQHETFTGANFTLLFLAFRFTVVVWNSSSHFCQVIATPPRPIMISVWAYSMLKAAVKGHTALRLRPQQWHLTL